MANLKSYGFVPPASFIVDDFNTGKQPKDETCLALYVIPDRNARSQTPINFSEKQQLKIMNTTTRNKCNENERRKVSMVE